MSATTRETGATYRSGIVVEVDEVTVRVRVRLPDLDDLVTAWLSVGQRKTLRDKDYWLPDVGEQVGLLLDANGDEGVVLCALYSDEDAPPVTSRDRWHRRFADGTTLDYDRSAHQLTINCIGTINIVAAGAVAVQAPSVTLDTPSTTCTGDLLVIGALAFQGGGHGSGGAGASFTLDGGMQINGDLNASGTVMDGGGNSNHHAH